MHDELNNGPAVILSVSDAVAVMNQTLEYAYPSLVVVGELSSFQISKGKWLYADIKDESAKLRLFGTVYMLHTPLEDGMMVEIIARPYLHPQFGFSMQLQSIRPIGEGSIKKSALLLERRLEAEGLFAVERKRAIPFAPEKVGLIASGESAAFADFIKIMKARWDGSAIEHYEVHVQGESAVGDIVRAVTYFNQQADSVEVLVVIRGGGSADDLAAFSTETVTRVIAGSRIPTVVAIGHETDVSLAERAADLAASTPSNAAELLFPDKKELKKKFAADKKALSASLYERLQSWTTEVAELRQRIVKSVTETIAEKELRLANMRAIVMATHPANTLKRGYALVSKSGKLVRSASDIAVNDVVQLTLHDGTIDSTVKKVY